MTKHKIIIDTDPGQDDAVAILLALASPEIEVLGITCVAGNVELELTTVNARKICELAGRSDIPVYKGSSEPMCRKLVTAKHVHGKTGLDGTDLPAPSMAISDTNAIDFLIESLENSSDHEITICALGPLTNIGRALEKTPKIAKKIDRIILMGGGFFEGGNITPAAEFNIYVDPEAASIVLSSKIPVTMIPLDVTHKVLSSPKVISSLEEMGSNTGRAVAGLLDFFGRYDSKKYGSTGAPLHDANVITYLLRPDYYEGKLINVEIETGSSLTRGMTVADWWQVTNRTKNVIFLNDVNTQSVLSLLLERLGLLP